MGVAEGGHVFHQHTYTHTSRISIPPSQGLGNAFLSHISACDSLFHVVSESKMGLFGSMSGLQMEYVRRGI